MTVVLNRKVNLSGDAAHEQRQYIISIQCMRVNLTSQVQSQEISDETILVR